MFQLLDVNRVEVRFLRALGRIFRYGVVFAYERTQGGRLFQGPGRDGPTYDIAQESEAEDPTIDEVRHVDPNEEWGP